MTDFDISPDKAILISPALGDMPTDDATRWSLVRPATLLPSYAAAAGAFGLGPVTNQVQTALAEVEAFAVGDYVAGLAQLGRMPADARAAFYGRIAELTGLDPALVARHRGRIDPNTFSKELLRDTARVLDRYDASRAYADPMPEAEVFAALDASLVTLNGRLSAPFFRYLADTFEGDGPVSRYLPDSDEDNGAEGRYVLLNFEANAAWDRSAPIGTAQDVGDALVFNDALDVLVVHGMFDTITPYFASCYLLEQSVVGTEARARLSFGVYQGGHMFYLNDTSRAAFHADLAAFYGR